MSTPEANKRTFRQRRGRALLSWIFLLLAHSKQRASYHCQTCWSRRMNFSGDSGHGSGTFVPLTPKWERHSIIQHRTITFDSTFECDERLIHTHLRPKPCRQENVASCWFPQIRPDDVALGCVGWFDCGVRDYFRGRRSTFVFGRFRFVCSAGNGYEHWRD